MTAVQIRPTPETNKVCDLLDQLIHGILHTQDTFPSLGQYEASLEGLNLLYLMIRGVEAVILLARTDLALLPSAMNLTRSVLEMGVKVLWMLAPDGAFDREVRWLAQLQTEEDFFHRVSRRLTGLGVDNSYVSSLRDGVARFKLDVMGELPQPYRPLSKIPDLAAMMMAINEEPKYLMYIYLSQYSHGTHVATGTYRRGLGIYKEFGEYITPHDWETVFSVCWYFLAKTARQIYEILGGDVNQFLSEGFVQEIQASISKVGTAA